MWKPGMAAARVAFGTASTVCDRTRTPNIQHRTPNIERKRKMARLWPAHWRRGRRQPGLRRDAAGTLRAVSWAGHTLGRGRNAERQRTRKSNAFFTISCVLRVLGVWPFLHKSNKRGREQGALRQPLDWRRGRRQHGLRRDAAATTLTVSWSGQPPGRDFGFWILDWQRALPC